MATVTATTKASPPQATVTVQFATTVTAAKVSRYHADGSTSVLRSGASISLVNGKGIIDDYEAPIDISFRYEAYQVTPGGAAEQGVSAYMTIPSSGRTWLSDPAVPTRYLRLDEVQTQEQQVRTARAGVFQILDRARPVVISAARASFTGDLVFTLSTLNDRMTLLNMLSGGQVLLLRTPSNYGLGFIYVSIGDATETRLTPLVAEQTRQWTLPLIAVDRPGGLSTLTEGMRWFDMPNKYANWTEVKASGYTWGKLVGISPT